METARPRSRESARARRERRQRAEGRLIGRLVSATAAAVESGAQASGLVVALRAALERRRPRRGASGIHVGTGSVGEGIGDIPGDQVFCQDNEYISELVKAMRVDVKETGTSKHVTASITTNATAETTPHGKYIPSPCPAPKEMTRAGLQLACPTASPLPLPSPSPLGYSEQGRGSRGSEGTGFLQSGGFIQNEELPVNQVFCQINEPIPEEVEAMRESGDETGTSKLSQFGHGLWQSGGFIKNEEPQANQDPFQANVHIPKVVKAMRACGKGIGTMSFGKIESDASDKDIMTGGIHGGTMSFGIMEGNASDQSIAPMLQCDSSDAPHDGQPEEGMDNSASIHAGSIRFGKMECDAAERKGITNLISMSDYLKAQDAELRKLFAHAKVT